MVSETWLATYSTLADAQRAYRRLCDDGVAPEALSLELVEICPACEQRQERNLEPRLRAAVRWGQALGGILGLAAAFYLLWGVGGPAASHWRDVAIWHGALGLSVLLCVLASYALVGAMVGAMLFAAILEARGHESPEAHQHYALVMAGPDAPGSQSPK